MKKKIKIQLGILTVMMVSVVQLYAQDHAVFGAPTNTRGLNAADEATLLAQAIDISKIEGVFYEFDDIRFGKVPTDGSFLLFENWENRAVLHVGEEKLVVSNINFHIDEEKFISQMNNDSTFVYDFKGIERIVVNDRPFISLYSSADGVNKVYEVIAENDDLHLVKNYYVEVMTGSVNPMINRSRNKIKLKSKYFVVNNGVVMPFNNKKSGFRSILPSDKANMLEKYAKSNKLSFRKDDDLKKMFSYLNSIQ
ncbi:MAG: hypothetical protein KJO49_10325 [Bacteroidia bacterium]|nr:hypothetical protein [Bacteroidia bacterium]NNF82506.1 hypothetical protein [Flavobacteriaceae bacterium]NNK71112.1 hypothetical protein [Flavobacteriaceae bacterium]NNL80764.1 hypothetical protein [Flavobacteriaceae bacterium]